MPANDLQSQSPMSISRALIESVREEGASNRFLASANPDVIRSMGICCAKGGTIVRSDLESMNVNEGDAVLMAVLPYAQEVLALPVTGLRPEHFEIRVREL